MPVRAATWGLRAISGSLPTCEGSKLDQFWKWEELVSSGALKCKLNGVSWVRKLTYSWTSPFFRSKQDFSRGTPVSRNHQWVLGVDGFVRSFKFSAVTLACEPELEKLVERHSAISFAVLQTWWYNCLFISSLQVPIAYSTAFSLGLNWKNNPFSSTN